MKQVVFGMFHLGNSFLSIPGECVWEKGFEITMVTLQWVLVALFVVLNEPWRALNFYPTLWTEVVKDALVPDFKVVGINFFSTHVTLGRPGIPYGPWMFVLHMLPQNVSVPKPFLTPFAFYRTTRFDTSCADSCGFPDVSLFCFANLHHFTAILNRKRGMLNSH